MATPSVTQTLTTSNWITSGSLYDYVKPQNNPKLIHAFGDQDITGMMEMVGGAKNPVAGLSFRHFEEDRLDTIVNATGPGGVSGVGVVYTLVAPYTITGFPSAYDPYLAASFTGAAPNATGTTNNLNPVRKNQTITFYNGVKGTVTAVSNLTFTVVPDKIGASYVCPTLAGTEPITLGSIVNGEGGDQPKPMNFRLNSITGVMQIVNEAASTTGSALGIETWIDNFQGVNGEVGSVWYYKNQADAYKRIKNQIEVDLVSGEAVTNTGDLATYDATLLKTSGLFTFAQSYSAAINYNIVPGVSLDDFDSLIIDGIDKNKGSDENSIWSAIRLRKSIDAFIRPEMQAGAISYGAFGGGKDQYVNFGFSGFEHLGKTFHLKTYGLLNDPTKLGAITKYKNMGVVIPMGTSVERMGDMKEKIETPAFRKNYVKQGAFSRDMEEWLIGGTGGIYNSTLDVKNINYRSHFGFEGFRPNAYAFLQGS